MHHTVFLRHFQYAKINCATGVVSSYLWLLLHEATRVISIPSWVGCYSIARSPSTLNVLLAIYTIWLDKGTVKIVKLKQKNSLISQSSEAITERKRNDQN